MKHTPGQWRMLDRKDSRGNPCGISIYGKGKENQYGNPEDVCICRLPDGATIHGGKAFPNQLANARLIAAAPQMYELLKAIAARFEIEENEGNQYPCKAMFPEIKQALAKAKGK